MNESNPNVLPDSDLLNDMIRVAAQLNKNTLYSREYARYGKYSRNTIFKRFGSWNDALIKSGLEVSIYMSRRCNEDDLIKDIQRVAHLLGKNQVKALEYNKYGTWTRSTAERYLKSWNNAVSKAGLEISTRPSKTSSEELVEDLRRVAQELNKQYISLEEYSKHGKHSIQSFYKKIGSWVAALKKAGLQEPKRKGAKPIKDIVLSEVRLNKIKIALRVLYPKDLPSLYKCQEHLSFRGHIIENKEVSDIARILRSRKAKVLREIRHVIDKIKIFYEIQPDNVHGYNYQRDLYKHIELILSDRNKVALLKNKGIIYMWQLMTVKLSELDLGKDQLLSLCNYLIRERINKKECKEILKHESNYYKSIISRGAGYDGLVYASFGQCPLERVDYKGLQEVISNFTYQQKIVIEEIFFNNKTLEEVGNIMNLTRERVRQIKVETLRRLRHAKWKKYYLS